MSHSEKRTKESMAFCIPFETLPEYANDPDDTEGYDKYGMGDRPKDCEELFSRVCSRQLTAIMFHSDMADLFCFLGLKGMRDMHAYQYLEESAAYRRTRSQYIASYGKLLKDERFCLVEVTPEEWYKHKSSEITPELKRSSARVAIEKYLDWEKETKEVYSEYRDLLMSWKKTAEAKMLSSMVAEVEKEIKQIESMYADLNSVGFSTGHLMTVQQKLSRKYDTMYIGVEDTSP